MHRKLPHAYNASVDKEKILGYLLNAWHSDRASKAQFFLAHGFTPEKWKLLAEALCEHGRRNLVSKVMETAYGTRYQIDGKLAALDRHAPLVRTIWQWNKGELAPRLITAYPLKR